ncbi:endonuclease domain-containing protein [Candidatus Cyanaurora vandensis]|uniref:endonuclease domain-containing protein n=1 Tax=Candidatus Cyanaurora vandensis TaxID=2714958 RepID=UPI0025804F1B|nr:DUF559 domain-containing protein [Candidatus Cyanaurora vandensis]
MKRRMRGVSIELQARAQVYRQQTTQAEAVLWAALRHKQLRGLRFRQQHPLGGFILDFYCPAHRLIIEVDGPIHEQQQEYDSIRSLVLEAHGCKVIRFTNQQILKDLPTVLQTILIEVGPSAP